MKELTQRQSSRSENAERDNYYYQWQILKSSGEIKVKRSFTVSVKTPKGPRKVLQGLAHLHGSA
jgi:hypothetical protein